MSSRVSTRVPLCAKVALRDNNTRSHDLRNQSKRCALHGRTSVAFPKMQKFVVASNLGRESVKASLRGAIARDAAGTAAKYGKHNFNPSSASTLGALDSSKRRELLLWMDAAIRLQFDDNDCRLPTRTQA